ncbi:MAG TPA: DUF6265 family protein [Capsulimonadaceae bacterium]|nr:DUF6265 family protein [Capsulimonadaceae bacterium]
MSRALQLASLGFLLLAVPTHASVACKLSDLSWMVGRWSFHAGAYSGQGIWIFSKSGPLIGLVVGTGAPSSGGVLKLSAISSEQAGLILRMRFFDGSLERGLQESGAPITFSVSSCGRGFVQFDGPYGEYTRYELSGAEMTNTGIADNNGKPGRYRIVFTRDNRQ